MWLDVVRACRPDTMTATATKPAATTAASLRTDDFRPCLRCRDEPAQPVLERHLGLPPEHLPRARDVGLAHLRVVDRQRLEDDLARRARHLEDEAREFEQRELGRVAEVD